MFIVFDLDDTLADNAHRHHILEEEHENEKAKWDAFFDACVGDIPVKPLLLLLSRLLADPDRSRVQIWTGRSERVRGQTEAWLINHLGAIVHNLDVLHMRKEGDFRPDSEVKADWIKAEGKPDLVFDDRNSVVKWWRQQGVVCCQVKESDY